MSGFVKVLLFIAVVLVIVAIAAFTLGTQVWGFAVVADTVGISLAIAALIEYRFDEVKAMIKAEHRSN